MTQHYSIEIISKKVFLKATYRSGKFRRIEHLRGKLDRELMNSIGKVIPVKEEEIADMNKKWFSKVNYRIEVKQVKSLNKQFVEAWFKFYEDLTGVSPKFNAVDGNAIKQIMNYLKSVSIDENEALATWEVILESWNTLDEFHQKQTDLKYINSKLNVIIKQVKQGAETNTDPTYSRAEL